MVTTEEIITQAQVVGNLVWTRFIELITAPMVNPDMLWTAIPLLLATLFITFYFGKHREEELGWNTAFGNTTVFLFVAIGIIREMYQQGTTGSWENLLGNEFYVLLSLILTGCSIILMIITYYHVLPKKVAFFLFSAPPINVSVYVVMCIVYAGVPADWITLGATLLFLLGILGLGWIIQHGMRVLSEEEIEAERVDEEIEEELSKRKSSKVKGQTSD